jgi:hypothetical protein
MKNAFKAFLVVFAVLMIGALVVGGTQISKEKRPITGNVVQTEDILNDAGEDVGVVEEDVIFDLVESIDEYTNYYRTFEISALSEVSLDIVADKPVNYTLLPESDVENFLKGESFQSNAVFDNSVSMQGNYDLESGNYAIMIATSNEPVKVNLVIKSKAL